MSIEVCVCLQTGRLNELGKCIQMFRFIFVDCSFGQPIRRIIENKLYKFCNISEYELKMNRKYFGLMNYVILANM